jgi:hypothetical protein
MKQPLNHFLHDLASLGLATFVRNWMRSLRYECAYTDPAADPAHPRFVGPAIYVFWHEYIPFMFYLRAHCRVAMLVSRHRDAELLSRAAGLMGFDLVRGSTRKGAVGALREMIRKGNGMNLTLTPDGPRGPRRQLAAGCIYMASRLEVPLIPVGLGYDRPWRNRRASDQFAIPRPWSRACAVSGPSLRIPSQLSRGAMESWRQRIEKLLNDLTEAAEQSAESGRPVRGAVPAWRACPPLAIHRLPSATARRDTATPRPSQTSPGAPSSLARVSPKAHSRRGDETKPHAA